MEGMTIILKEWQYYGRNDNNSQGMTNYFFEKIYLLARIFLQLALHIIVQVGTKSNARN